MTSYNDAMHELRSLFENDQVTCEEPFRLFQQWFTEAKISSHGINPSVMCLSTATKNGLPSGRLMICTEYSEDGFKFFTDSASRKGQELEENPYASMTYFWPPSRSVRVEGGVEKLPTREAEKFFSERSYEHQVDALCSEQSRVVKGHSALVEKANEIKQKYLPGSVPKPQTLCGYVLKPGSMQFYQSGDGKMQERLRYRKLVVGEEHDMEFVHKGANNWFYEVLAP